MKINFLNGIVLKDAAFYFQQKEYYYMLFMYRKLLV